MLVSTSWLDYTYFNDSTSTCCKVVFVYLGPSQPGVESGRTYVMIAQVASKYTQTLSGLHGLIDTYSLGINWDGHRSGLDNTSRTINFIHFSGVKNHLLFPHILHMICFYIPELFPVPKYILFVSRFQVVCRPLAPRSGDYEQCRLKLAATVLCTTGNRHTVRRRHPTRCSNADISCFSENYILWIFLYDFQCSFTFAMLERTICVEVTNLSEH